jgi:hypothetical protein
VGELEMKSIVITLLLLSACETRVPYYDAENLVSIDGLSIESQMGNISGEIVEISGSGFGEDPYGVTVMFGHQNGEVLDVTDSLLSVTVPHGPVSGGAVDVRVGNANGQANLDEGYSYNIPGNGMEAVWGTVNSENQIAYVSVSNDMMSCYGGTGTGEELGCTSFALTGNAGIEGRSEVLEIVYPNAESPYALGKGGFANSTSVSWESWGITTEPHDIISIDDEGNVKDFRLEIDEFTITNPNSGGGWCSNLPSLASFVYNGESDYVPSQTNPVTGDLVNPDLSESGYMFSPSTINGNGDLSTNYGDSNGCYAGAKQYALDELQFCMTDEYETGQTLSYEPEWPVGWNFFQGIDDNGELTPEAPVAIQIEIEKANISQELYLPPYAKFSDSAVGGEELWALSNFTEECPDTDDDRITSSDDGVFNWSWEPVTWDDGCTTNDNGQLVSSLEKGVCIPDGVKGINSYVTATVSYLSFSWMGGEGISQAATISIPDEYNYDEESGLSSLSLPTWVMYSFPSAATNYGEEAGQFGESTWRGYAAFDGNNYGLMVITLDRIVEYTLETTIQTSIGGIDEEISGDLVFAYSTGDMGYFSFENPLDSVDTCGDCIDNDGDGWLDDLDPDCTSGEGETNATSDSTCNNGIDDDGDGLIDAEDDNCVDGSAGESADCSNGIDDDADGWTDQEDPDCQEGGVFEDNATSEFTCNNGVDDDLDGWIDGDDLACDLATNDESDGFADADDDGIADHGCNDGIDNDGNGDIDSADIYCFRRGPSDEESPVEFNGLCADGIDNDEDGYIDEMDPACELTNGNSEYPQYYDNTDDNYSVLGNCNDGIDNDCDGQIDTEDPGCFVDGVANPYIANENDDGSPGDCNCADGIDNDSDGWVDDNDLDCNGSEYGTEIGFVDAINNADGSEGADGIADYACNNGIDDDADGLIDAFDVYCWERAGADGDSETPNFLAGGICDNQSDDDADGFIDFADPGCDKTNGGSEAGSIDLAHWDDPTCLDGVDNDGDGLVDGLDTDDCANWFDNGE